MPRLLAVAMMFAFVSSASAQIIYEPVRYQYGGQNAYYYGGRNASVFRRAEQYVDGAGAFGRVHGFAWVSGNVTTHREVSEDHLRVYADALPRGNAAIYGYTIDDARNEAYANAPRYFRKSDLLAYAKPDESGTLHVPAQVPTNSDGGVISIKSYVRPAHGPTSTKPILVVPKDLLNPPSQKEKQQVASVK